MSDILTASYVWRDYVIDGIPSSGKNKPKKIDARQWGSQIEGLINAFTSNGGLVYQTQASLFVVLSKAENTLAWVVQDPVAANNGIYMKIGASGAGSWVRVADLPYSFIIANDSGHGSPNAIAATSSIPVSASTMVIVFVNQDNVGSPVTISFNGGVPLTIKSSSGNDLDTGGVKGGSALWGVPIGNTFRLANDEAIANVISGYKDAAIAARVAAETARDAARTARDDAKGWRDQAEIIRDDAATVVGNAQNLVDAAQAGYVGFQPGTFYDLGRLADPIQLFPSDFGRLADL